MLIQLSVFSCQHRGYGYMAWDSLPLGTNSPAGDVSTQLYKISGTHLEAYLDN